MPLTSLAIEQPALLLGLLLLASLFAIGVGILYCTRLLALKKELKSYKIALKEQRDLIEENNREKGALMAIVCHDIANPLSIIEIALAAYGAAKNEARKNDLIKRARKASLMIKDIICSVKDFESVVCGKKPLELKPTCLLEIFEQAECVFKERLHQKNLKIRYDYKDPYDLYVMAEKSSLLNSVINNLLSNAIKFSLEGTEILITVEKKEDKISLFVRDYGIGMPESLAKNIFRSDIQTSRLGVSGETGTGFGMPIARAYMKQYGGFIGVLSVEKAESETDHGTLFHLVFNAARPTFSPH